MCAAYIGITPRSSTSLTLGAWWAGKKLAENPDLAREAADEDVLRRAVSPPGYAWTYLRFVREDEVWRPAAGTFPGWPARAAEITVLDPCMGSGHFLVFALDILVAMRKAEETLTDDEAVVVVLRDNLHGLEIDPRCTQIAAFALALAAWKRVGGVRSLPTLHLACSGLAIGMGKAEFVRLAEKIAEAEGFAGGRVDLLGRQRNPLEETALARRRGGLEKLYDLFSNAPIIGSLIDPRQAMGDFGSLFAHGFADLAGAAGNILRSVNIDENIREAAVAADGLAKAADLLSNEFTLVCTNVPYLGRGKQDPEIQRHLDKYYDSSKGRSGNCVPYEDAVLSRQSRNGWSGLSPELAVPDFLFENADRTAKAKIDQAGLSLRIWRFRDNIRRRCQRIPICGGEQLSEIRKDIFDRRRNSRVR